MFTAARALALSEEQISELKARLRNGNPPQKMGLHCRVMLLAHQGMANQSIAEQLHLSRPTVISLRSAFDKTGMAAITGFVSENVTARC